MLRGGRRVRRVRSARSADPSVPSGMFLPPNDFHLSLSGRPSQGPSAQQVHVQVKDGLSGAWADIENCAVTLLDVALASDQGGRKVALADDFRVGAVRFFLSGEVPLGNH